MVSECVQVIDENGNFVMPDQWGAEDSDARCNFVTAIGPQFTSTGHSALLNLLFGTNFGVDNDTRGIWLCPAQGTNTVVADIGIMHHEDQDQDMILKRISMLFSISVSHVVMIDLLGNQTEVDQRDKDFLKMVLSNLLFWIIAVHEGRLNRRILVLVIVRESISMAHEATLIKDIEHSMQNLSDSLATNHCKMSDFVQLAFTALPHKMQVPRRYEEEVDKLRRQFMDKDQEGYFFQRASDNNFPSPKMIAIEMKRSWEELRHNQTVQNLSRMLGWHEKLLSSFTGSNHHVRPQKEYPGLRSRTPLFMLRDILRKRSTTDDVSSVVNPMTLGFMHQLLDRKDYINIASELNLDSDVENLLDFILYLLDHDYLSNAPDIADANRRARRLMLKIIQKTPVFPKSLILSGVKAEIDRDFIGQGGFGYVFRGQLRGSSVALKLLVKVRRNDDFCREALVWRSLSHESVLPFLGIHEDDGPASLLFLVSPYMKNGTLSQWRTSSNPPVAEIQKRVLEVAEGIQYIHSEGIVHGDLRGDNVLLDLNFHAKITDFGLTRHSESTVTESGACSYHFAAPELFGWEEDEFSEDEEAQKRAKTHKTDVYAFGCLYYETHFGVVPFANSLQIHIVKQVTGGERPPRLSSPVMSDKVWRLINRCWRKEPMRRPAMENTVEIMMTWRIP